MAKQAFHETIFRAALSAGADDFMPKASLCEELLPMLRQVKTKAAGKPKCAACQERGKT